MYLLLIGFETIDRKHGMFSKEMLQQSNCLGVGYVEDAGDELRIPAQQLGQALDVELLQRRTLVRSIYLYVSTGYVNLTVH